MVSNFSSSLSWTKKRYENQKWGVKIAMPQDVNTEQLWDFYKITVCSFLAPNRKVKKQKCIFPFEVIHNYMGFP